jgi:NADH-quinone oxidoreductase subunit E
MNKRLKTILSSYQGKKKELIPILQHVQSEFGYLPEKAMVDVAKFLKVAESKVYAVATFYAHFRFIPIGKHHICVCRGTACHVRGAPRILDILKKKLAIDEGETSKDMHYSLETVACVGACGLAPNMTINKNTYGHLTAKKVSEILGGIRKKGKK